MWEPDKAHIVYATDDGFAEILGISLVSLYENSMDMSEISIYILDSGVKTENRKKIDGISRTYGRDEIRWIPAKNISEILGMHVLTDRGSLSQYARLFISSCIPPEMDRVLYLDCDILVEKSIRELWNLDLKGKTIGALMDAFSKYYRKNIGLQENDIMFNSGVMLIDLKLWREKQVEKRLMNLILEKEGHVQQGDQGALNAVLSKDVYCFDPKFNTVTIFYDFSYAEMMRYRKPPVFYSKAEIERAVADPSVIHFTTSIFSLRPWVTGCEHRYVGRWKKYQDLSPWKEAPEWKDSRSWKQKIVMRILGKLPRNLVIWGAGIAQAYLRPLRNQMR